MPDQSTPTTGPPRARHIVDTMSDREPPEPSLPGAPKPLPAVPVPVPVPRRATQPALPLPRSTFSTYAPFQPKCGHLTMARVYHLGYRCERCNRHGAFGWLYRCTEHRELILDDLHRRGFKVSLAEPTSPYSVEQAYDIDNAVETAFDALGQQFCEQMSLGKWGADKRQDKYSLLHEMSQEQMQTYTPQQIATLLAQRENVWKTAELQMHLSQRNRGRAPVRWSLGPNPLVSAPDLFETIADEASPGRPWVPRMSEECSYKACHACYRRADEKAWLNLDAVLNGDILPTAATAYSFHSFQARPVCKASVVGTLGYRAVPLPRSYYDKHPIIDLTQSSEAASSGQMVEYTSDEYDPDDDSEWVTTDDTSSFYSDSDEEDDDGNHNKEENSPPRPLPLPPYDHRRVLCERRVASSAAGTNGHTARCETAAESEHVEWSQYTVNTLPYLPADFYESAVFGPLEAVALVASNVPLPGPTFEEELFFTGEVMAGMNADDQDDVVSHHFGRGPPHVPGGIAVREEAEEAGLADIVTQV